MLRTSVITDTDSYKFSHYLQYPPNTTQVSSYIESRGGEFNKVLFFGARAYAKHLAENPITKEDIERAEYRAIGMGYKFNRVGWEHILNTHAGHFPVLIEALKEGTVLGTGVPLVQIMNIDPKVPWLTSHLETSALRAIWYPTTVATLSWTIKDLIYKYLKFTCDDPDEEIKFRLHDFGARGVSSRESAMIGGAAHLINFMGTDTVESLDWIEENYEGNFAGFSIPASEHSTITAWGRENEADAYRNMIDQFGKGGIFACVSDSYDIMNAVNAIWGGELREAVLASGARLVVRPDSGDPTVVPIQCIEALGERFGFTVNSKGYKVLHPSVRVIQGDGINLNTIREILLKLHLSGWSAENLAFGMGGALLQGVNRDTLKFAMKASAARINGVWCDVYKDPITDAGKRSKRGKQAVVVNENGELVAARASATPFGEINKLEVIYMTGELYNRQKFYDIRELSNA